MRRAILLAILFTASAAFAQLPDFSKVEIKVQKVADGVYMLQGAGGNIGVSVGEDGFLMVDDEFAPLAPKIRAALKGIEDMPLRFIINTHYHRDHTGANAEFGKEATIIAQENLRKRLAAGTTRMKRTTPPAPKEALPIITFADEVTVHLNGEDIRAVHIPNAHTDGDSVVFFSHANVVHMGDNFVTYGFPIVDTENGGSVSGMIAGDEKVLSMAPADAKFIPGHGPLSTADDVRKFIQLLKDTRQIVADAVTKKMSLEEMKQKKILAKYDQYGTGNVNTDTWIETLYADVTSNTPATAK